MDINFLAAANGITNTYFNHEATSKVAAAAGLDDETKKSFEKEFEQAYDSLTATKMLSANLRESYEVSHQDDFRTHASRLGYSIDNRVIDMLNVKLTDDMNEKVNTAMNNALNNL